MTTGNVTHEISANFLGNKISSFIYVQTTKEITTAKGRHIGAGSVIVIDPNASPEENQMVLVGNSIVPWAAQKHDGVAVKMMSDKI